jgi:hypothetical protein|tara:strand:+ start:2132 stop:3172 length:1041 start_codon:yes stop_codon:yes gene_type:complete
MASTYSDRLKLELMATGANASTWGDNTNTNLKVIDAFNAGFLAKSVAGSADITLSTNNSDPNAEASNKVIEFTGALTGDIKVFVPAVESNYIFFNNTTGSQTLTVAPTGHTANGVAIVQGAHTIMYCKGNRMVDLFANSFGNVSAKGKIAIGNNINLFANGTVSATTLKGDGGGLTGVQEFPAGTKATFVQTSAPTGFTTDTSATLTECCLQVVNGTGGGTGGSDTFSTVFTGSKSASKASVPISTGSLTVDTSSLTAGATTLSTPQIPSHSHPRTSAGGPQPSRGRGSPIATGSSGSSTGGAGGGGSHSHTLSGISLSGSLSSTVAASVPAMNLKFADSIIATKD